MAKYAGFIGFEIDEHEDPNDLGVWIPTEIKRKFYTGDLITNKRKWESSDNTTLDGLRLNNKISIVMDLYMKDNWPTIKYVEFANKKWKVDSIEIKRPRIILDVGGVWHGHETGAASGIA